MLKKFSGNDHAAEGIFNQPTALQTLSLIQPGTRIYFSPYFYHLFAMLIQSIFSTTLYFSCFTWEGLLFTPSWVVFIVIVPGGLTVPTITVTRASDFNIRWKRHAVWPFLDTSWTFLFAICLASIVAPKKLTLSHMSCIVVVIGLGSFTRNRINFCTRGLARYCSSVYPCNDALDEVVILTSI